MMFNLKSFLQKIVCFTLLLFVLPAYADSQLSFEPELENQRDPNQYCAKCHKFDSNDTQAGGEFHLGKFHGKHLSQISPNSGKPITCVSCHGNISEDHRKGVKDVMRFQSDIFSHKNKASTMYTVEEQNQVCFACHKPDALREKLWAHDVHAMKLPCAACHTLHPEKDAMVGIEKKAQVKLCVDCHGKQQQQHTTIQKSTLKNTLPSMKEDKK